MCSDPRHSLAAEGAADVGSDAVSSAAATTAAEVVVVVVVVVEEDV
jgi:hypothetical protein